MAPGKHRTTKRSSSGSSYASTATTFVFVGIFILGIWMLTSNSYVSPNKSLARLSQHSTSTSSQIRSRKIPVDSPAFQDNPGNLPKDAIQGDEGSATNVEPSNTTLEVEKHLHVEKDEKDKEEVQLSEESAMTQNQHLEGVPMVEIPHANNDNKRKSDHREKQNDIQMNMTVGNHKWGMVNDDKNQQGKMTVGDDKWGIRKMTVGNGKWGMVNDDKNKQKNMTIGNDKWGTVNDDKNQQRKIRVGDDKWGIRKMTVGNEKWGMVNDDKNQQKKMTIGNDKWGIRKMTVGDNKWGMVNDDKNQQRKIRVGDDKWGMVNRDKHDVTEEEKERIMDKHQQKQEESKDDEEMSKALIPKNETKPPVEVAKTKTTTTSDNDSKVEVDSGTIPKESNESTKGWLTQAGKSDNEKERQEGRSDVAVNHMWELCNVTSGTDYVPCLDNEKAVMNLRSRKHFEHRERHCPEEAPMCLVPIPEGYKTPIPWPQSRDKVQSCYSHSLYVAKLIWFHNVPHRSLAYVKGHQNWVKVTGEFLTFPGGGTQFINGALHYIDVLQQAVPEIEWGKHTRVVLDVGCGVASFGGFLFDRNVLAMSLAPKDEHEAQIQFALERGIPAFSAVMGSQRLPFPSNAYDLIHCARCRVPWHREGGMLLLELNRLLRPGGYFVWSATPVYRKNGEDAQIWKGIIWKSLLRTPISTNS
ncbi:S-adenosyl-L-methionine-dependent methyltransferases superfamily protein [Artemisia annua]|uniref:Methyltransferase n=1 Tax=Artemisia annua TaxID=35608 RepID=A0A2U1NP85_ARTAN|nr:S-adenosyl-L-methionine-dependent methyltransferases superfamily protein [Artemisia annua]